MGEGLWPSIPPKRILLATDLSAQADRALDRAVQLANQWGAELLAVHALEGDGGGALEHHRLPSWRRPVNSVALVEAQIRDDMRAECPRLRVHAAEGAAGDVILDVAERERCDLIVVGAGRHRSFAWSPLGRTTDELFRRSPVSVLVVKKRPRAPYAHLLVGTDFTDEARASLEAAARYLPHAAITVMHAYEMPYRALLLDSQLGRDFGEMERATLQQFIDGADLPEQARSRLIPLIEHGAPEVMLASYATEQGADLTVIGAYERSRLFHTVVVGKGPRIVETSASDILVVRAQRPGA